MVERKLRLREVSSGGDAGAGVHEQSDPGGPGLTGVWRRWLRDGVRDMAIKHVDLSARPAGFRPCPVTHST